MSGDLAVGASFLTALTVFITAVTVLIPNLRRTKKVETEVKTARKEVSDVAKSVDGVHVLVNSRYDSQMARMTQLEKALRDADVIVPLDPAIKVDDGNGV